MQAAPGAPLIASDADGAHRIDVTHVRGDLLCASVAPVACGVDVATKVARGRQADRQPDRRAARPVAAAATCTRNSGAAFSIGTGYPVVLDRVSIVVVVVVLGSAGGCAAVWAVALGLLLAGALGNLTDRLFRGPGPFRGHVVDFLALPHWPVFNLADSASSSRPC